MGLGKLEGSDRGQGNRSEERIVTGDRGMGLEKGWLMSWGAFNSFPRRIVRVAYTAYNMLWRTEHGVPSIVYTAWRTQHGVHSM